MTAPETPLALLLAMRALLTTEGAWNPRISFSAADARGRGVAVRSDEAVRWGVLGAAVKLSSYGVVREDALGFVRRVIGMRLCLWDERPERTQAEVLAMLDAAITLARGDA